MNRWESSNESTLSDNLKVEVLRVSPTFESPGELLLITTTWALARSDSM